MLALVIIGSVSSDLGSKFLLNKQQHWTEAKILGFIICVEL